MHRVPLLHVHVYIIVMPLRLSYCYLSAAIMLILSQTLFHPGSQTAPMVATMLLVVSAFPSLSMLGSSCLNTYEVLP